MERRILSVLIMIFLALSACSKKQQPGEIYFPKAENGAQWVYAIRYSTSAESKMGVMMVRIGGDESINGKTYYKQITLLKGVPGPDSRVSYNRRAKEGIYKIDETTAARQEYLATPFPLKVGDTWTVNTSDGHTQFKAEKLQTIELNKQKYENCLRVIFQAERGLSHFEGVSYFAPKIGEVYSILNLGDVKVDYGLVKYKLQ